MGLLCNLVLPSGIKLTSSADLVVFSWDDQYLLTCHGDQGAVLWDVSQVLPAQKLELEPGIVTAAVFTATLPKHLVLTCGLEHLTQQFRIVGTSTTPYTPEVLPYPNANVVKSSPEGTMLAFATAHTVEIRATGSGGHIRSVDLLREAISLSFSRDSRYLAVADAQSKLSIIQLDGDEVLQSTLGKLIGDYTTSIRPCQLDTEPGWTPIDIMWHAQHFGLTVSSQKESSPGKLSYRLTRWFPHSEELNMPLTQIPSDSAALCKYACLAPNVTFFACITTDHDLTVRDLDLRAGYSVGLKSRAAACFISTSSHRVAFSCLNGRLGIWHVGQPLFGCQGG